MSTTPFQLTPSQVRAAFGPSVRQCPAARGSHVSRTFGNQLKSFFVAPALFDQGARRATQFGAR
jgi:hypothetical protein